jgi:hypothetical protein
VMAVPAADGVRGVCASVRLCVHCSCNQPAAPL